MGSVVIIVAALHQIYRLAQWRGLTGRIREFVRRQLVKRDELCCPSLEEMLGVDEGFCVVRLVIPEGPPLIGSPFSNLELKKKRMRLLSYLRGDKVISLPHGENFLLAGDVVICYGDNAVATSLFHPELGNRPSQR